MTPRNKSNKKTGRITPNGVSLEKHEYNTVIFFTEQGFDIELIRPSNTPRNQNADFVMKGVVWEMKCPTGKGKNNISNIFKKAILQSENIIFDLRQNKVSENVAIKELEKLFKQTRRCRKLIVITKDGKMLDFKK